MLAFLQIFCRNVLILLFLFSFAGKVCHLVNFEQTITHFALLPRQLSRPVALLFLLAEALVVMLLGVAGPLLLPGYLLAAVLLLIFCAAMLSVLARHISATCSCFGSTTMQVSPIDIVRNTGFIACALGGCFTLAGPARVDTPDLPAWVLSGLCALVFVVIWTQLGEIARLFR